MPYIGTNCEVDFDECAALQPCKNGATCIDELDGVRCECPDGFEGEKKAIKTRFSYIKQII